uniref:ATP synthase complex subunit 8 n=1 Tax=Myrmus lateralis TaxID=2717128 RepID=A0A6G8QTI8_9HEMI|nr:ATP synthase F0 subunit 8 [Myrmus lateralis]QIN90640.1 ATP synthase F0 subunit 8 [Myrmus lateralis]
MPQMAPLWWEILFMVFIMLFILMSIVIYYNTMMLPKNQKYSNNKIYNQMNWKW